ncbi:D-lactaldehyde dehydrogenase [Ganoderma leucocontextum]|nr:D-lactaldehyde dehydrogenase [Ganoderma leucocontextum]
MPALSASDKVLITGVNGFISAFSSTEGTPSAPPCDLPIRVKCFSRLSPPSFPNDRRTCSTSLSQTSLPFEHAYDDAVRGVAAVVHIASPNAMPVPDPQMIIRPAVDATVGLINSSLSAGMPSSALSSHQHAVKEVEEKGSEASVTAVYSASKVLAEQAACKLHEKNKERISWDISVICPGWVFATDGRPGPASPAALTSTANMFYEVFTGIPMWYVLFKIGHNFVDVRDLAEGHLKALEIEEAGDQRFILTSQWLTWQEYLTVNTARELNYFPKLDKGDPHRCDGVPPARICSNEKAKRVLGIPFRKMSETLKDILDDYRARGWLAEYE